MKCGWSCFWWRKSALHDHKSQEYFWLATAQENYFWRLIGYQSLEEEDKQFSKSPEKQKFFSSFALQRGKWDMLKQIFF